MHKKPKKKPYSGTTNLRKSAETGVWVPTYKTLHYVCNRCTAFPKKASIMDWKQRFRFIFATIVGCAGVLGSEAMGVMSGEPGDLGDATTTASSLLS